MYALLGRARGHAEGNAQPSGASEHQRARFWRPEERSELHGCSAGSRAVRAAPGPPAGCTADPSAGRCQPGLERRTSSLGSGEAEPATHGWGAVSPQLISVLPFCSPGENRALSAELFCYSFYYNRRTTSACKHSTLRSRWWRRVCRRRGWRGWSWRLKSGEKRIVTGWESLRTVVVCCCLTAIMHKLQSK